MNHRNNDTLPKIVIFSGAGLSVQSGLATFRDSDGLWAKHDPMIVCNYTNWEKNFDLVHDFYNLRRQELAKVEPNQAHKYFASLEATLQNKAQIIHLTQNVDDLLERAGVKSKIIHLHGELTKLICPLCNEVYEIGYEAFNKIPCKKCGYTKVKPNIVFFFEQAPLYTMMYDILESLESKDCIIVIGTSGSVIDISGIIKMCRARYAGLKILNNLEYSESIDEMVFDKIYYQESSMAITHIDSDLSKFLCL